MLEPEFRYWFDGDDACVAYAETARGWVAAGAPICAAENLIAVAQRFCAAAQTAGKRACFFATKSRFAASGEMARTCIGEQPVWDPQHWSEMLASARSLREQIRRAANKGLVVREAPASEFAESSPLRRAAEKLCAAWLQARRMAPMGFLVGVELFGFAEARRYFVAEQNGVLVALLAAVPIYARSGWLVEDLLRSDRAPNGTAEALVDIAMRNFAQSGSRYATLGLAPLAGEVAPWLRTARDWGRVLYDFDGVRAFKSRLRPTTWDKIFLVYPSGNAFAALRESLRAFAGGHLVRFGLQTLLRGPPIVVRALAALLVPWTLALALVDTAHWFPARSVQWAWVGFDVVLCIALWRLSQHWQQHLAAWLAGVITLDALATLAEALWFNLARLHSAVDAIVLGAGVLAPIVAASVMWGALARRGQPR